MIPVPAPYIHRKKPTFQKMFWKKILPFLHRKLFYKENIFKFHQFYCKMRMKKILNEGNQLHNFISSSGSGTVINYGFGSNFLTSYRTARLRFR
jgi:hypothetical protein